MKESVTEDTFILACTSPLAPLVGLCDAMRTSGDVFESWEAARCMFAANINRYFINDYDCMVVREASEEDELCGRKMVRNIEEIKSYLTAMAYGGGTMMLSDNMSLLPEEKLRMLSAMFPYNTETAIPLDFTETDIPGILDLGYRGNTRMVALINWDEKGREVSFEIEPSYGFEFWSGTYLGRHEAKISRYIEPHHCEVLFLTRVAPVAIVGVDDCLYPTIQAFYEDGVLKGSFVKKGETMYLVSQKPIKLAEGCTCELVSSGEGQLYKIGYTGEMDFTVK